MEDPGTAQVRLYLENAREMVEVAQVMLDNDFYSSAINRSYYAIFYATNALLITQEVSNKKHSGVLSDFRRLFVKTGIMDSSLSRIYGKAFEDRNEGDYDLEAQLSKEDAQTNLTGAKQFVEEAEKWLRKENWI